MSGLRVLALALLAALLLPSAVQAQSEEKLFLVAGVARDGDALVVTLQNGYYTVYSVTVTLTVDGNLAPPEQRVDAWAGREQRDLRFEDVPDGKGALTIRYVRPDSRAATETATLRLPEASRADVQVVDAALVDGETARIVLENVGTRASGSFRVSLWEPSRGRVGEPLQQRVDDLPAGARVELRFALPARLASVRVDVARDGETLSTEVALRAAGPARLEVIEADVRDGEVNLTLLNAGATASGPLRVAVEDTAGTRIGAPLSREVASVAPGGRAELTFRVPAGTDRIRVVMQHGNGTDEADVRLSARDGGGSVLGLATDLPSREGEPGSSVSYALTLSNAGEETLVGLRAEGLPEGYDATFSIDGSAASRVQAPRAGERRVVATVSIPDGATRDVGTAVAFAVVANATDGTVSTRIDLSLSVRGKGRLELQGQNWFATTQPGVPQELSITLRNVGSAALRDISLEATRPTGWGLTFEPATLAMLGPGESRTVTVTVAPPADAGAGRYLLDLSASTRDATARPRSLTVEVAEEAGSSVGWLVGAGVAGLAATALIVKLRRR